jgi:hypothetical protein
MFIKSAKYLYLYCFIDRFTVDVGWFFADVCRFDVCVLTVSWPLKLLNRTNIHQFR